MVAKALREAADREAQRDTAPLEVDEAYRRGIEAPATGEPLSVAERLEAIAKALTGASAKTPYGAAPAAVTAPQLMEFVDKLTWRYGSGSRDVLSRLRGLLATPKGTRAINETFTNVGGPGTTKLQDWKSGVEAQTIGVLPRPYGSAPKVALKFMASPRTNVGTDISEILGSAGDPLVPTLQWGKLGGDYADPVWYVVQPRAHVMDRLTKILGRLSPRRTRFFPDVNDLLKRGRDAGWELVDTHLGNIGRLSGSDKDWIIDVGSMGRPKLPAPVAPPAPRNPSSEAARRFLQGPDAPEAVKRLMQQGHLGGTEEARAFLKGPRAEFLSPWKTSELGTLTPDVIKEIARQSGWRP